MINYYDIEYKDNLYLDLHLPENDAFDLFVYFHGGGLCSGSRKGFAVLTDYLAVM